MSKKHTSEQFWKLYEKLPQELKDALFAEETGNNIHNICERNEIEKYLGEMVDYVGQVLVGVLPLEDFQEILEKELKLKKSAAKKVAQEINRFIFYPVKPALEEIYKVPITPPPAGPKVALSPEAAAPSEEKPTTPPAKDVYREPIE